jgi:NADH dehydrogenase
VPGFDGVFAVGDIANIPGADGRALPQLGSVAQQSGKWAGKNIAALIKGKKATPFHYHDKGIMAMIGRNAAVAEIGPHRHQVDGPIAFAAWLGLHAILLSGTHSRVDAFLNWAEDYFHHNRAPDLELAGTSSRIAWAVDPADKAAL